MTETTPTETKKAPTKRDVKALFDSFRREDKPDIGPAQAERLRRLEEFADLTAIIAESFEKFAASATAPELVSALKNLQQFHKKGAAAIADQSDAALLADPDETPAPVTRKPRVKKLEEPAPAVAVVEEAEAEVEPESAPAVEPEEALEEKGDNDDSDYVEPMTEEDVADETPAALVDDDPKAEETFEAYNARRKAERAAAATVEEAPAAEPATTTRQLRSGPGTRVAPKLEEEGF